MSLCYPLPDLCEVISHLLMNKLSVVVVICQGSSFTGNVATGQGSTNVGTGGALAVVDACTSSSCGAAAAIITNSNFNDNFADQVCHLSAGY